MIKQAKTLFDRKVFAIIYVVLNILLTRDSLKNETIGSKKMREDPNLC